MISLLTGSQTAKRLGICHSRVRQLALAGALRTYLQTPIGRLFDLRDVDRFRRQRARDRRVQWWRRKKRMP